MKANRVKDRVKDRPKEGAYGTVADVMRPVLATVEANEQMDLVQDVMNLGQVRHMPVVDGDRLVGLVSQRDLLAAGLSQALEFDGSERRSFLRSVNVSEAMTACPITASPELPLEDAASRMLEHRIGCLPVVDERGNAIGILTETDLLRVAFGMESPEGDSSGVVDVDVEAG